LRLAAPAKLNLYLHVTGRRADGYHLLDGLVAFADIADELTITPATALSFAVDGPFADGLGDGPSNLVVRAARSMAELFGRRADFAFALTKNLPVASGIGGGSADAAACIRGIAELWGMDPNQHEILRMAERLGSDLPVCVRGTATFIGGTGADLDQAPELPPAGLVLVNPRIPLPTPSVYRARTGPFTPPMRFSVTPADAASLAALLETRRNDLTGAAIGLVPSIGTVLAVLTALPGCLLARMSGSGATCFALFADRETAAGAAMAIREQHQDWWVAAGRLVTDSATLDAD
jgi:4-diphosphocytidyl-2-C-methyl-D-erythritol kinase